jgi:hypothetical protein
MSKKKTTTTTTTVVTETVGSDPAPTLVSTLIDRSGSMSSMWRETKGGYQAFLDEQLEQPGEARYVLAFFDSGDSYDVAYDGVEGKSATGIPSTVNPRGVTPLYDAIAQQIGHADTFLAKNPDYSQVIVVIMTDGQENSSSEYAGEEGRRRIHTLISEKEAANWQFMFLGANIDTMTVAADIGIVLGTTTTYDSTTVGHAYASASQTANSFRATGSNVGGHTDVTNDASHPLTSA